MKIWKEFNSSHSSNISIVGSFDDPKDAEKAYEMIKDFTLSSWEERHPSLEDFNEYWAIEFHPDIPYLGIFEEEIETGIDNEPDFELIDGKIKITHFRSNNFGGILKLMRFAGANKIVVK